MSRFEERGRYKSSGGLFLGGGGGVEEEEVHLHTAWNLLGNFAPVPHAAPKPFRYLRCYVFLVFEMPKVDASEFCPFQHMLLT